MLSKPASQSFGSFFAKTIPFVDRPIAFKPTFLSLFSSAASEYNVVKEHSWGIWKRAVEKGVNHML